MYSKTRNSLVALIAASMFLASTWMLGQPLRTEQADMRSSNNDGATAAVSAIASPHQGSLSARANHSLRLRLAMPYYSFSLTTFDRGVD